MREREAKLFKKRRSEIQIIEGILGVAQQGARKTELLYKGNMSFLQLNNYLSFLIDNEIIREDIVSLGNGASTKIYKNTEKGNDLLEDINKLLTYFE